MKTILELKESIITEEKANKALGYREVECLTQLEDDDYEISKCVFRIDRLNAKVVKTEYQIGIFDSLKNYDDCLFVRKIIGDKYID